MPAGLPVVEVDVVVEGINKIAVTAMATVAAAAAAVVVVDMVTAMAATNNTPHRASNHGSHPRRPVILGLVLACRLRRLRPMLPVVVVTTKGMATRDTAARTTGMTVTRRARRRSTEATKEVATRGAVTREAATKEVTKDNIARLTARARIGVTTTGTTAITGINGIHGDTGSDDFLGAAVRGMTWEGWYCHAV
jgi:hypothetical protein